MSISASFTLALFVFFALGCAKEGERKSQPVRVELKGNCGALADIGSNLSRFAKGELSTAEIAKVWGCVSAAVSDYERITAGDLPGGDYSPQYVRQFFEKYFLAQRPVSDELLASLMQIKRVLVAGSANKITHAELVKMQDLLRILREVSVELAPHAKVALLNAETASDDQIRDANEVFDRSLLRLGQWLLVQNQDYDFDQAHALIHELQEWMKYKGKQSEILENFEKAFAVVPALKQILLSGSATGLKGGDWLNLTKAIGQTHAAVLALRYSFKENIDAGLNREALALGMDRFVQVLDSSRKLHPSGEIPLSEWDELFQQMEKTEWFAKDFTAAGMSGALSWTVNRLLTGRAGTTQTSLKAEHLQVLRKHIAMWLDLRKHALGLRIVPQVMAGKFRRLLERSVPAEWDREGRQVFSFQPPAAWTPEAKLHMVWPYIVINWIKESFVGSDVESLNEDQMAAAGREILPVLQRFGLLKETKLTIGKKLLREADLFTLASNGDSLIDVSEATRYLAFVASSFRAAQIWLKETETACPTRDAVCVRAQAVDPTRDILTPLPRLKAAFKSAGKFSAYSQAAEETILTKAVEGAFSTGDLLQVWMIFHYIEAFDRRFDTDQNERIDLTESWPAYGLFGPTLGKLLAPTGLPRDELLVFFTFMLKYGDTPFTMFGGQVAYNHWKWHRNDWAFQSDRQILVGVLKQLSKL